MIYLPIIGAFIESMGTTLEKRFFSRTKMSSSKYATISFLFIVLSMIPFIYFFWSYQSGAFETHNLILLFVIILFSAAGNLCTYYALKGESIAEFEPIWLTQPLFTILLAFLVYGTGGNTYVFLLAVVASLTLVLTHIKKRHLSFNRYTTFLLLGNLFYAIELVASRQALHFMSPFTLYFIRCAFVFIILAVLYRPNISKISGSSLRTIFYIAVLWVFYRLILYQGYVLYGVIFTTMVFILAPVFLLVLAKILLGEKMTLKQGITTLIILICVGSAIYLSL